MVTATARGIRNNNPLNLRIGNDWVGEVPTPTDPDFEQFTRIEYGLRAGFIVLRRYINRYGRNTITKIISSWAPSSENCTERYIDFVSTDADIPRNYLLTFDDRARMCRLVRSMCQFECGFSIPLDIIEKGYNLAK